MSRKNTNSRKSYAPAVENQIDTSVLLRAIAISGVLLGVVLALSFVYMPQLLGASKFAKAAQIGIELFFIWVVITSTIRSIHAIRTKIPNYKLLIGGFLTAILAPLVRALVLKIIGSFNEQVQVAAFPLDGIKFFAGLGLLATAIALIRLRVRNRAIGNMLELALIALVAFLFFYFMK